MRALARETLTRCGDAEVDAYQQLPGARGSGGVDAYLDGVASVMDVEPSLLRTAATTATTELLASSMELLASYAEDDDQPDEKTLEKLGAARLVTDCVARQLCASLEHSGDGEGQGGASAEDTDEE